MALGIVMVLLFDFFTRPARMPHREPMPEPVFPRATPTPTLEAHPVTDAVSFQPETTTLDEDEIGALMAAKNANGERGVPTAGGDGAPSGVPHAHGDATS